MSRQVVWVGVFFFFFFNDTATTEIYPLSLHDALPIYPVRRPRHCRGTSSRLRERSRACRAPQPPPRLIAAWRRDRKSTRLNSSHSQISYAVFCLKKKKTPVLSAATFSCAPTKQ